MSEQVICKIVFDDRLESYSQLFDHPWSRECCNLADGTKVEPLVSELCLAWKSISNTFRMPWLMIESIASSLNGFANANNKNTENIRLITEELTNQLAGEVSPKVIAKIRGKNGQLADKIERKCQNPIQKPDKESLWKEMINPEDSIELQLGIWGCQRTCFGSIYYQYEHFLRESVAIAKGLDSFSSKKLVEAIEEEFGPSLAFECYQHPYVQNARSIRNALAHNGGTVEFQTGRQFGIRVEDYTLQIMAPDNVSLMAELQGRVTRLVKHAVTLPQFSTVAAT